MKKIVDNTNQTNFNYISIILNTPTHDENGFPIPFFPEPRQVRVKDIWPDYLDEE